MRILSPVPSTPLVLFAICVAVYTLSHYGGIRSPDGEVYYLTAEALADRGSFAVESDLDLWPGFGLAPGVDGKRYSIFGPAFCTSTKPSLRERQRGWPLGLGRCSVPTWVSPQPVWPASISRGRARQIAPARMASVGCRPMRS